MNMRAIQNFSSYFDEKIEKLSNFLYLEQRLTQLLFIIDQPRPLQGVVGD